jgi:hypothetical protein
MCIGRFDRFKAIGAFGDQTHVRMVREKLPNQASRRRLIIDDDHG